MPNVVFNIAKGRVVELFTRVDNNDPTNSAIVVVPVDANATSDATAIDFDTWRLHRAHDVGVDS
jgi:hypothetical protein